MVIRSWLNRILGRPIFSSIWMTQSEKQVFYRYILNSKYYLEFGMGGSSIAVLMKAKAQISCVESSPEWINKLRKYSIIKTAEKNSRLKIKFVDIGEISNKGFPVDLTKRNNFPKYSSEIFNEINPSKVDGVLIDGRFRVACILQTILYCNQKEGLIIMIHDIWTRPHYHTVLKYLHEIERIDSLGIFRIRDVINLENVKVEYGHYKFDPR